MAEDSGLLSILRDKRVRQTVQRQFILWLEIVADPKAAITKANLSSNKAFTSALTFALFAYAMTVLVALPEMLLFEHLDLGSKNIMLVDFVLTVVLGFSLVGLTFYSAGRLLGGHGRFRASLIVGFYLCALWPILQAFDYILLLQGPSWLSPSGKGLFKIAVLIIVILCVVALILVKVSPVMALIHRLGRLRATTATLIQALLMFIALSWLLAPVFAAIFATQSHNVPGDSRKSSASARTIITVSGISDRQSTVDWNSRTGYVRRGRQT